MRSFRLSTRLGLSHGVLVALLLVVLGVTLQGLVRMRGLLLEIGEKGLSSVDAEEELHRATWKIEVAMRHGRATCEQAPRDNGVRVAMSTTRATFQDVLEHQTKGPVGPGSLLATVQKYRLLADEAEATSDLCAFLLSPATDQRRAALDEELTDAWIDRLSELHVDITAKEVRARRIGTTTALAGLAVTAVAVAAAIAIARSTSRSVSEPIGSLAASATRLGRGDFEKIAEVSGPREVEELWRDLERARERLAELDQLKQSFLASVSHELRSPLTSVREALALLADGTCGALTDDQRRVVKLALRACEREVRIVEALLDLSRFRSGMPLKREAACQVEQVLEAAVDDERDNAENAGVKIELEQGTASPPLQIDSDLVERAIANLVRNAISVSKKGQRVRVVPSLDEAGVRRRLAVDIIDEGPGLPETLRDDLFRPFTAAPISSVDRPAGIGLGLSFAREVARAHGGDVTVTRSDTTGTTFRFELPIQKRPGV